MTWLVKLQLLDGRWHYLASADRALLWVDDDRVGHSIALKSLRLLPLLREAVETLEHAERR